MKPAHFLYSLQQLDLEMASHTARLREIEAVLASEQAIQEARAALEAARKRLLRVQVHQRDLELEAQKIASELRAAENLLYSGRVRNPKELDGLQRKAESLRKRRAAVDDQVLEAMLASEEADAAAQEAEATLKRLEAEREATCKALIQEREDLKARLRALQQRRETLVAGMPAEDIQAYEALRARRGSRPVALVQGSACRECGIALPTAVLHRARDGRELVRCPNCDRILCVVD
ncbi:MAG: zinc ribbon domain-containing protein [Anaerolineae bacterium]